jgi:diguanylate cyclase (GGDEF)-like protein
MTCAHAPATKDELASVALEALRSLKRPVGVVGADGGILVANELFCNLFCGGPCGTKPGECIESASDLGDVASGGSYVDRDGRTFKIETVRLAQGALVVADDISRQLTEQANAGWAARTDPESALGNRLMFRERLTEFLQNREPEDNVAAVLTVGIDRFKAIKTTLGGETSQTLLRRVADRLRSAIASNDFVARIGDDEFAILQLQSPQPGSASALAARLVDLLGRAYLADGHLLNMDACIGISLIPADGDDCDKLLSNADLALARARQDGPGRFHFFESAMDAQQLARRSLEVDLRRALALRELALVYQPQFNLASGRITGFEALLRWRHPKRGFVSPVDFIPLAEELGLIAPIGEWVLRKACHQAAGWPDRLRVAVNVSAVQFRNSKFCAQVSAALDDSGLDPERLELEITEGVLLDAHASVLGSLHRLRGMGVRVSMDDFGTGYSSLSYLHSFPFEKIKIDQSFVRGAIDETSSTAIIRAIAALGQSLGMTTTAEGVETDAQLARVMTAGCTDIQGYLISKPLAPESVQAFLQSRQQGVADATANGKASGK